MQFLAASASLFAALAIAAPTRSTARDSTSYENIDIADLYVRKNNGIQAVGFKLSGNDGSAIDCSASTPGFPSDVITCGETKYRFALYPGQTTEFGLRIYHELGTAFGYYGEGDVPTYCHAGGNGPNDYVCDQTSATTIVIDAE
ncbi:hypothetical protein EJ05DRAFT_476302 [Pseudovirgaria hyperparasitica]|uniref:AA1-like domain-containing protein n=1 Tax=Pseudovirgaria hyperparasitica TaxID=470096 RepID=A0A6A6W8W3_9PEZI|nr:uncharacterized protein EJ05DRAFT_476302 [Pseudovirgaria hyperparasitica]KAF2758027.1 hypothetical protein EJ05DRAFT_476302 [Pseudovirgaria hyperparasitica]